MHQNNIFLFSKKIIFDMNKSKQSKIIKKIDAKKFKNFQKAFFEHSKKQTLMFAAKLISFTT
jgi:hypothetical protein